MSLNTVEVHEVVLGGDAGEIAARSPLQLFWRRFRQDRSRIAALVFIVLLILVALFAPLIVKLLGLRRPTSRRHQRARRVRAARRARARSHLFGVDELGRDVFARVIYGARVSLEVAFIATGLAVLVGVDHRACSPAYYRGWVDTVLSRAIDVVLAFPILLLAHRPRVGRARSAATGCLGGAHRARA